MKRPPVNRLGVNHSAPAWLLVPGLLAAGLILIPVLGLTLRIPWAELPQLLTAPASLDALRLSLITALISTCLCLLLGVPLALLLARARFRGLSVLRATVLLPLVLPPVVGGLALLWTFGRSGFLGESFEVMGIPVAFTTAAVVLAQTFVAMPFLVVSVEQAVLSLDSDLLDAAALDGAGRTHVLTYIVLPLIGPGLGAGAVLAFARALGEFGATLAFAGSLQGVTRTLPLEIYLVRETDPDAAVALSAVLVVIAVAVIALVYSRTSSRR